MTVRVDEATARQAHLSGWVLLPNGVPWRVAGGGGEHLRLEFVPLSEIPWDARMVELPHPLTVLSTEIAARVTAAQRDRLARR